ncbi:MAG: PTS sugar transporter subunit IIA, partial [Erysipelotrichia bacterium]|nr:PTS sugar transporter subunit IIA [Erysipelotrichia bacterium]
MIEMLKEENVQIVQKVTDWVDAIHVALTPLVEQGYCEARYIDGIIRNTKKYGPYYVLCENLALLHASSSDGVIKKQIAVTVLKEPVKFNEGTTHMRYLLKWALSELGFQTQRLAIPVRFDEASDYLQFLHQQWLSSFLAVHNLLPAIASQPSENTEEARYLRQKLRQSFEHAFETFLTCNQRLLVSDLPVVSPHEREASGLLKQVALDTLAMWKNLFETLLTLSNDANSMKIHANAEGNIEINLSVNLPNSYLKLTHWLENEGDLLLDMPLEQPIATFPRKSDQPSLY